MTKNKISNNLSELKTDKVEFNKSSIFEITIPFEFGFGKNEIKINLTNNSVRKGSEVLIDVNDIQGNPIYYEISPIANVDKSRSIIIEVDEDTIEGKSTFILVSTLTSGLTYKCILEIPIVKGIDADSEIRFDSEPIVIYREKSLPTQKFTTTSRLVNRTFVGGLISSQGSISPKQLQSDNLTIERPELVAKTKSNSVIGNIGSSSIQEIPTEFNLSTITSKNFAFSSSMKGGMILLKNINLEVPSDAISSTPFYFQNYSASILEVNNTGSIQVYPPFFKQIEYQTNDGNKKVQVYNKFINEHNFTASFYDTLTLIQSTFTQSYAVLDLFNLETNTGNVDKIEVSYKSLNNIGTDFQPIGKFDVKESNLLVDSASLFFDNELGIIEKPVGNFRNGISDFELNWVTSSNSPISITSSISNKVKDGIKIERNPILTGSGDFILFAPKQYHSIAVKENTDFELRLNVEHEPDSNQVPQLDVYISGSSIVKNQIEERIELSPLQSSSFGSYIGSVGKNKSLNFTTKANGNILPIFVQRNGNFHVGNIELRTSDQNRIFVPMNLNSGSEISIKIDYLNKQDRKSRYSTILDKIFFTGSKFPGGTSAFTLPDGLISGSDQLTSSFDNRYERKGTGILSSSNQIASDISGSFTNLSSSFSTRIDDLTFKSGSYVLTSSYQVDSGSWNTKILNINNATSSYLTNQFTSSYQTASGSWNSRLNQIEIKTGSYASTGSNQFNGNQSISGSLNVSQSINAINFNGIFNGVPTSSAQIKILLPDNIVSGSEQLTSSYDIRYERRGTGIFSSSQQIGPTGIYSGSGIVPYNTKISSSNVIFITSPNDDLFVSGFRFDSIIGSSNESIPYSGSFSVFSGDDGDNLRSFMNVIGEEGKIEYGSREISAGYYNSIALNNSNVRITHDKSGDGYYVEFGDHAVFNDSRTIPLGMQYGGDYSNTLINNPTSHVDVYTVRKMFSSASLFSSSQQVNYNQLINKPIIKTPGQFRILSSDGTVSGSQANQSVTFISSSAVQRIRYSDMVEAEQAVSSSFWTTEIKYVTQSVHLCNNTNTQVYIDFPVFKINDNFTAITSSAFNASYAIEFQMMLYGMTGSLASPMDTYSWGGTIQCRALANPKDMPSISPLFSGLTATTSSQYSGVGGYGTTFSGKSDLNRWFSVLGVTYLGDGFMQLRTALQTTSSFNWTIYAATTCKVIKHEIRI